MRGEMLWFNEVKDRGLIRTDEGERVPVDGSGFAAGERPEGRCAARVVTLQIEESEEGRRARNVAFEPEGAARRARTRFSGRGIRQ